MTTRRDRFGRAMEPSEAFAKLQTEWYDKLEASGFEDIEPRPERLQINSYLRDHWIETKKRVERGVETGKAELFRLAYRWMDIPVWRSRHERWGWAAWTSGWDFREITARFPSLGSHGAFAGRARTQINRFLKHFRAEGAAELAAEELGD